MADVMLRLKVSADGQGNLSAVAQGLEKVEKSAKTTNTELKTMEKTFSTGLGLGAGVAAFQALASSIVAMSSGLVSAATEAADYAEKIGRLRTSTGLANETIQRLDRLMVSMGGSTEQAAAAMNKAQRAIAGGDASLKSLGLSVSQLRAMNPEAQFEAIAKAIMEIPNHTDRAAAAMKVFGKSGAELLPVLEQVAEGALKVGRVISDENIAALERLDDYIDAANESWKEFSRTTTAVVVRALEDVTAALFENTAFLGDARSVWDDFWNAIINGATFMATMVNTIVTSVTESITTLVSTVASNIKTIEGMLKGNIGVLQGLREIGAVGAGAATAVKKNFGSLFQDMKNPKWAWTDYSAAGGSQTAPSPVGRGFGSVAKTPEMSEELKEFEKALKESVKAVKSLSWYIENALPEDAFVMGLKSRNWSKVPMVAAEGTLPIGGVYGYDDPIRRVNVSAKETAKAIAAAERSTIAWQAGLQGVALLASSIGGKFGDVAQVIGNIGQSFAPRYDANGKRIAMTGMEKFNAIASGVGQIGGLIGGTTGSAISGAAGGAMTGAAIGSLFGGAGAVPGAIIGGAVGLIGGIFAGKKKEKEALAQAMAQLNDLIRQQFGSFADAERAAEKYGLALTKATDKKSTEALTKQLDELAKRMKGTQMMVDGIIASITSLTYEKDGQIFSTFEDPAVLEAVSGQFATTFWAVWRREGLAGIDKLRPMWDKLHQQLVDAGFDPTALGFGQMGDLFGKTADPRMRAILGLSSAQGQLMNGALDAGYASSGMVAQGTTIARETLKELEGQGLSAEVMAEQLVALNRMYAATGQEMPEDLKRAMEEAGLTILPTQLEVLEEIRDILKGAPSFAQGGYIDAGTGTLAFLHGRERIMREDDIDREERRNGGGGAGSGSGIPGIPTGGTGTGSQGSDAVSASSSAIAQPNSPQPTQNQIVIAPTLNASAYNDAKSRQELSTFMVNELINQVRNNPTLRKELRQV